MLKQISNKGVSVLNTPRQIVRCTQCKSILAFIHAKEIKYIYLDMLCSCGANPYIQAGDVSTFNVDASPVRLFHKGGSYICQRCSTPVFDITDSVINFSFRVVCNCGEKYNRRFDV